MYSLHPTTTWGTNNTSHLAKNMSSWESTVFTLTVPFPNPFIPCSLSPPFTSLFLFLFSSSICSRAAGGASRMIRALTLQYYKRSKQVDWFRLDKHGSTFAHTLYTNTKILENSLNISIITESAWLSNKDTSTHMYCIPSHARKHTRKRATSPHNYKKNCVELLKAFTVNC